MKVSLNWLKEYVDFKGKEKLIPSLLNSRTMEVEKIISYSENKSFKSIVVGEIISIIAHPESGKFAIAHVYAGEEVGTKTIVFTKEKAEIKVGDKPLIAIKGAVFENGLKIREKSIVGTISEGAFCSEKELGFSLNSTSILKFSHEPIGKTAFDIFELDDTVLEFDLEPNRPDLFGIQGFAYELSAILDKNIKLTTVYDDLKIDSGSSYSSCPDILQVKVANQDLIPVYIALQIDNIKVGESNSNIKNKLIKSGIRPINNIVDLTNLVMLETAQPLHAFDKNKLTGKKIYARTARRGETVVTLDGKQRLLQEDDIVIADDKNIIALAGIMGASAGMIESSTNSIVVEAANFNMSNIRKTSRIMSLRTDASTRFEKGLSPVMAVNALKRFLYLIKENISGAHIACYSYAFAQLAETKKFVIYFNELFDFLGQEIEKERIITILKRLGFNVKDRADKIEVAAPYFRSDITDNINIYEEIFRIHGYEKIKSTMPYGILNPPEKNLNYETAKITKDLLGHLNFIEIITPSFTGEKDIKLLSEDVNNLLELKNPISIEYAYLRTSLIPDNLKALAQNLRTYKNIKIFEIGKTYFNNTSGGYPVLEKNRICGSLCSGIRIDKLDTEFYNLKGVIEFIFKNLGIKRFTYETTKLDSIFDLDRTNQIFIGKTLAGIFGEIKESILKEFEIDYRAGVFDIDMDVLKENISYKKTYMPLSKYPAVEQDISIIVSRTIEYGKIEKIIKGFSQLIKGVSLVDIYNGSQIEDGEIAYLIRYYTRAEDRTLTMEEVNNLRDGLIKELNEKFGIILRGQI